MDRDTFGNNSGKSLITPDLAFLLTSRQRRKFVRKIFNGNEEDFEKFLALSSNIQTYKDASILLDFYLYKNEVDPSSKEAIDFRNVIYFAYFPNKRKRR
jgi:hypothetical protein